MMTSELQRLKNAQCYLEKADALQSFFSRYGEEVHLYEYYVKLDQGRTAYMEGVSKTLRGVMSSLQQKKKLLELDDMENLDLEDFRKTMITVQESIQNLGIKLKGEMERLLVEEKDVTEDVEVFRKRIDDWEKPLLRGNVLSSSGRVKVNRNRLAECGGQEAKVFMDFVASSNGHEGGWASKDHLLFLRMRHKFKDTEQVAQNVHRLLPDITPDDVKEHELWYRQYLSLKSRKKEALRNWRKKKNEEGTVRDDLVEDCDVTKETTVERSRAAKDFKEELQKWKEKQLAKKQLQAEQELLQQRKQKDLEQAQTKMREAIRESVEKWRQARLEKELHLKTQEAAAEVQAKKGRALEANRMIKLFRSQDDFYIFRMRKNAGRCERDEAKRRSKSGSLAAKRDPERVLRPTQQWLNRTERNEDGFFGRAAATAVSPISNIRAVSKLRIPEWRKQLPPQ